MFSKTSFMISIPLIMCINAFVTGSVLLIKFKDKKDATLPKFHLHDIGVQGLNSKAMAINEQGMVVGSIEPYAGAYKKSPISDGFIATHNTFSIVSRVLLYGINNENLIVGSAFHKSDHYMPKAIMLVGPKPKSIFTGREGDGSTIAKDVNDDGVVLGYALGNRLKIDGKFFYGKLGSLTFIGEISPDGNRIMSVYKINNNNFVAGSRYVDNGYQAVLLHGAVIEDLPNLRGYKSSCSLGLNDHNEVVGFSVSDKSQVPTFWSRDKVINMFESPNKCHYINSKLNAQAVAVNNDSVVVGRATGINSEMCGFIWENGQSYNLNKCLDAPSKWHIVDANGINDHGQIIASGYAKISGKDEFHAILLEPCK